MTKNEFKKIAKNATRIVNDEKVTGYNNSTSQVQNEVTYTEMIEELSHCHNYYIAQGADNTLLVSASIASFTVYL